MEDALVQFRCDSLSKAVEARGTEPFSVVFDGRCVEGIKVTAANKGDGVYQGRAYWWAMEAVPDTY